MLSWQLTGDLDSKQQPSSNLAIVFALMLAFPTPAFLLLCGLLIDDCFHVIHSSSLHGVVIVEQWPMTGNN